MKKLYTLSLLLVGALSFGQVVLTETFSYTGNVGGNTTTPTDATGANNWLTHSNTSTVNNVGLPGTIAITDGSLSYPGLFASAGNKAYLPGDNATVSRDINREFTSTATTLYYSALINIVDNTQLSATISGNNNYFLAFGATAGTAVTTLGARLAALTVNEGANYRFGIQNNNGGSNTTYVMNPVDLNFGTTYLVVVKYDISASPATSATLWVNPASIGATEPASTVTSTAGTTAFTALKSINLRNAGSTPKAEIDEIRIGTTWASVTPVSLGVNENAIAGLKVYPNPLSGSTLFIDTNANAEKTVVIYDVLGKVVLNTKTASNALNVSSLNGGVYVVKITEEGNTATRKLVIK